jgi:hypothetical protein
MTIDDKATTEPEEKNNETTKIQTISSEVRNPIIYKKDQIPGLMNTYQNNKKPYRPNQY